MILDEAMTQNLRKVLKELIERTAKKMTTCATNEIESNLRRIERSCWKINNEKHKLVVGLWKTSQNYEVTTRH